VPRATALQKIILYDTDNSQIETLLKETRNWQQSERKNLS